MQLSLPIFLLSQIALLLISTWTTANEPTESAKTASPISLQVEPTAIELRSARDQQAIVVIATFPDGSTQDVSSKVEPKMESIGDSNAVVEYVNETFIPKQDGATKVTFSYGGLNCSLDIRVNGSGVQPPVGFRNEVLPVLTRAGCNTGKCHGSASGKDGFRLSLFGYDPAGDQFRLTREQPGRRVHLSDPINSLILLKAIGSVPHTGGTHRRRDASL